MRKRERESVRANRARILRGAQCGVSGPSNACKQSQKTTMMMERGTRERLTDRQPDRETVRMRMRIRRRRRHGNNIASPLSLSLFVWLSVAGELHAMAMGTKTITRTGTNANANTSKAARQNKGIKAKLARQTDTHKVKKERQLTEERGKTALRC